MQLSGSFTQSTVARGALGPGGSPGALRRSEPGSHRRTADIYWDDEWVSMSKWVSVLSPRTRRWEPEPINTPITTSGPAQHPFSGRGATWRGNPPLLGLLGFLRGASQEGQQEVFHLFFFLISSPHLKDKNKNKNTKL